MQELKKRKPYKKKEREQPRVQLLREKKTVNRELCVEKKIERKEQRVTAF